MLPLAGSPRLTVLGREVRLGVGSADLLAVESFGRLVIIEVKLAGNAESRRAVVAQVLSYAGYLQGLDPVQLEAGVLAPHLPPGGRCSMRWRLMTSSTRWTRGLPGGAHPHHGRGELPAGDRARFGTG